MSEKIQKWFFGVFMLCAFAFLVHALLEADEQLAVARAKCEEMGGKWFHPYQSDPICLAKGTFIP
jgi:hypothetical protein